MKETLKKIAIISGMLAFILPIAMLFLWHKYIDEQSQLSNQNNRQACEPYDFSVGKVSERMQISWKTDAKCAGFILLASTYSDLSNLPYKVMSSSGDVPTTEHTFSILKQDEAKYRYVVIVSEGEWYGIQGSPIVLVQ